MCHIVRGFLAFPPWCLILFIFPSISLRPSAPTSPPNCCLMVQLLRNTLEHRLRDQGYCDGSPSHLNQKRREGHKKNKVLRKRNFISHRWMDYCEKHEFGCLLPRLFSFKPVLCEESKGAGDECRFSQSCFHVLILCSISCTDIYSNHVLHLCSVQPTTYSIDQHYFSTFTDRIYLSCMSSCTPVSVRDSGCNLMHFYIPKRMFLCVLYVPLLSILKSRKLKKIYEMFG